MFEKRVTGSKSTSGIGTANIDRYTTAEIAALTGMIDGDTVFDTDLLVNKNYNASTGEWEVAGTPESLAIAYAAAL